MDPTVVALTDGSGSDPVATAGWLVLGLLILFVIIGLVRSVRVVKQTHAYLVERLGRYSRTLDAGLHILVPFIDRIRADVDLREQVVSFPPQPVITSDNLVVSIDTVIYFQVSDPKSAVYEIANYITGIEQLTVTTLRNVVGSMDLEQTLTSRDQINGQLSGVLDEATGRWGVRVGRVELKSIDPPQSIQGSMEQQMRAERDRRAKILTAEGVKQSQILTAEGDKQAAILRAEGNAQAAILNAEGEARAILQVFDAIHRGDADPKLLAYQYLQMLPEVARTQSNKMWFIPTEFTAALGAISAGFGVQPDGEGTGISWRTPGDSPLTDSLPPTALADPSEALAEARRELQAATEDATNAGKLSGRPFERSVEAGQRVGHPVRSAPAHAPVPPARPQDAPQVPVPPAQPQVAPQMPPTRPQDAPPVPPTRPQDAPPVPPTYPQAPYGGQQNPPVPPVAPPRP